MKRMKVVHEKLNFPRILDPRHCKQLSRHCHVKCPCDTFYFISSYFFVDWQAK